MRIENSQSKTTSTNPVYRSGRHMSWGALGFCLLLLILKYIS